jgi:hypothetical protein
VARNRNPPAPQSDDGTASVRVEGPGEGVSEVVPPLGHAVGFPRLGVAVLLAIGVAIFCAPMFVTDGVRQGDDYRDEDWLHDISFSFHLAEGLRDGELPLRSKLVGGGYPILGHPSDGTLSPLSLPFLVLPVGAAVKFNLLLLLWLGALGMHGLAREQLRLEPAGAIAAALAFVVSGWFPSMMLAGFYVQALYLLAPLALHLLLGTRSGLRRALGAGLVLLPLLLQAGPGLLAVLHFVGVSALVLGTGDRSARSSAGILVAVLGVSAAVGLAYGVFGGVGVAAVALTLGVAALTLTMPTGLTTMLLRVALLVAVLLTVGAAKWVSIVDLSSRGTDFFALSADAGYPYGPEEDTFGSFYSSPGSFLQHLHSPIDRVGHYGDDDTPDGEEYASLGLTLPLVLLFGVVCAVRWRRMAPWAMLWLLYVLLCFGPNGVGDAYRWLVWSLPGFSVVSDPYKYFNFFLLIPVALAFGLAVEVGIRRWGNVAAVGLGALLLLPALQNGALWGTLFSESAEAQPEVSEFHQLALEPPADLSEYEHPEMYRESFRPDAVREFFTLQSGVGVINWYADIYLPENAVPRFRINDLGRVTENSDWRGEVWTDGLCSLSEPRFTSNTVSVDVRVRAPCTVVVNQNHDPGFVTNLGEIVNVEGLLGVTLSLDDLGAGSERLVLRYRPRWLLRALGVSGLSLAGVLCFLFLGDGRRREWLNLPQR